MNKEINKEIIAYLKQTKHLVFFGENGITITSANHTANKAKERTSKILSELNSVKLYDKTVEILTVDKKPLISRGFNSHELTQIPSQLNEIGKYNSLIAYLREAIKAKEHLSNYVNRYFTFDNFIEFKKYNLPTKPNIPIKGDVLTSDDVVANMNIKERNEYYYLGAMASTIGNFIHVDKPFYNARLDLKNVLSNPTKVSGVGDKITIYTSNPSVNINDVESMNELLMEKNRDYNARLNAINHKIEQEVNNSVLSVEKQYNSDMDKYRNESTSYNNELSKFHEEYNIVLHELKKDIQDMKIVLPNDLMEIYDSLKK